MTPQITTTTLPSFGKPPVAETVLGFQFDPIPGFSNAHLGAFWKRLGGSWTNLSDMPPLEPQHERFGAELQWAAAGLFSLRLSQNPGARLQVRNAARNRMVQIQNGRLHYNWIGHDGSPYIRYQVIRPEFEEIAGRFRGFLKEEGLAEPRLNQWEVTYVNHIRKGGVWNSPTDWQHVFNGGLVPAVRSARIESIGGEWHYEIEPERGRLHVQLQHGRAGSLEAPEALILTLTARGPASGTGDAAIRAAFDTGLDTGHAVVVESFVEMTSSAARAHWEEQL
jgi:uncharacterized protein (TIGR04255 family)